MKRVLVIEDNEANLYLTSFLLEKNGYAVITATDGASGVELAVGQKPDLVLMDIQLPDIDGLEATRRIREAEVDSPIPIVALTSYAMPGDRERAHAAGCTAYVEKPIDPDIFLAELDRVVRSSPERGQHHNENEDLHR